MSPSAREAAAPPPAPDRTPQRTAKVHEGFYLRVASGPSLVSLRGHGPLGDASFNGLGRSGSIAIGHSIAPGMVLAGVIEGAGINSKFDGGPLANARLTNAGADRAASRKAAGGMGMIGMLFDCYPKPTAGWHAGASVGVGAIALTNLADDSNLGGVNLAGSLFGGYDWALGHDWALGLQLTASGATETKLSDDSSRHDTGYRLTPVSVGVQASILYF